MLIVSTTQHLRKKVEQKRKNTLCKLQKHVNQFLINKHEQIIKEKNNTRRLIFFFSFFQSYDHNKPKKGKLQFINLNRVNLFKQIKKKNMQINKQARNKEIQVINQFGNYKFLLRLSNQIYLIYILLQSLFRLESWGKKDDQNYQIFYKTCYSNTGINFTSGIVKHFQLNMNFGQSKIIILYCHHQVLKKIFLFNVNNIFSCITY
ncbi:hypothetical protein ABPG74_017448 [Tetrahymena malaccensis]